MSLGRLLRRASSKASDFLTLTPGGGGGSGGPPTVLDGEIIYSKNNVCVHPPEGLQGLGEHHPGYLCLYMEKDELLGATLILAWVPNSRIQKQDEEALRYITPESSPVRKAPRPRGRRTQSSGAPHQPSPTEPRSTLIPRDEDILVVAQSIRDTECVSPSPEDGEKLAPGLGTDGPLPALPPAHSDSGILSAVSSQDGMEEGREPRPEVGEEEGSLELSAEGVSRASSFDSDSEAFSSPFCLSPISAALAESSSSVFLESESGEPGSEGNLKPCLSPAASGALSELPLLVPCCQSFPISPSQPLSVSMDCLFWTFHINGIMQLVSFRACLLSLSTVFSRSIQACQDSIHFYDWLILHSSILAWKIPWTEEPGRLQSMGSQRVGHN